MTNPKPNDQPLYDRKIVYDRAAKDFAAHLDGEVVGFARTYHEAEVMLDQLVCELIGLNRTKEAK